jgi:hypothetical protein
MGEVETIGVVSRRWTIHIGSCGKEKGGNFKRQ